MSESVQTSKLIGEYLLVEYSNVILKKKIVISFAHPQNGRPFSLSVLISNIDGDQFSLNTWANKENNAKLIAFFGSVANYESESLLLSDFKEILAEIAVADLRPILVTDAWESIPIDWRGYC